jgi:hypothetical protein
MSGMLSYVLGYALGLFLALAGMVAAGVLLWITFLSFTRDLWTVAFVFEQRRTLTTWIGGPVTLLLIATGFVLFGHTSSASLFPVLAFGPWLTIKLVAFWSWRRDGPGTRNAAHAIRMAEALRIGDPAPSVDRRFPWPDYIFDVARAEQRALYEPPPI